MSSKRNEKGNCSFVSIITGDDYLPGLLVLHKSLANTDTKYPFLVLITKDISTSTMSTLDKYHVSHKTVEMEIDNPTNVDRSHRWFPTYSKLNVFDQTQYDKVVYLDADMLILRNIDELFEHKHMSAVIAGGMLPGKSLRRHLNSGMFVIEPSRKLFEDMINKIGKIEKLESGGNIDKPRHGSDQDFLNAYYSDWPNKKELHLDHKYNIIHYLLDEYSKSFGYSIEDGPKPISIIHYASYLKPWNVDEKIKEKLKNDPNKALELQSILLWQDMYKSLTNN
jgi:alpha-N-acetylglucosamine transferase